MNPSRYWFHRIPRSIQLATALFPPLLIALLIAAPPLAAAASKTYRCEAEGAGAGKVTYSDAPCRGGKQAVLDVDAGSPSPADRAAALSRARSDKAQAEKIDQERDNEIKQRSKRENRLQKQSEARARQCARLEVKVKRAREDLIEASVRESQKKRTKLRRAEEDYAAACR